MESINRGLILLHRAIPSFCCCRRYATVSTIQKGQSIKFLYLLCRRWEAKVKEHYCSAVVTTCRHLNMLLFNNVFAPSPGDVSLVGDEKRGGCSIGESPYSPAHNTNTSPHKHNNIVITSWGANEGWQPIITDVRRPRPPGSIFNLSAYCLMRNCSC